MAGYEFRLEQVLKFRKEVEKMKQVELIAARERHDSACDLLLSENASMELLEQEFSQRQMQGIQASDLQMYGDFRRRKIGEIHKIKEALPELEKAVHEKRESLLTAAKEKRALEIFKEKKMRDLKMEHLCKERIFMDEVAVQSRGGRQ